MAAHAVGDRPQALPLAGAEAVLIMVAHPPFMGPGGALDPERREGHRAVSPGIRPHAVPSGAKPDATKAQLPAAIKRHFPLPVGLG